MSEDNPIKIYIAQLYDSDKQKRAEAGKCLVNSGKKAVLPLIGILDDQNWIVRYRAAEALGLIKDERAVNSLTQMLKDPKDHVRYMAVKGLGIFGKKELSMSLLPLLRDENEYVRRITAQSLGTIGGATAYGAILKAIESEKDERAKEAMKEAIIKMDKDKLSDS